MNARLWRRGGLFGALATTIVLTAVSGKQQGPAEPAAAPQRKTPPPLTKAPPPPLPKAELALPRPDLDGESGAPAGDTFAAMSWHVPPPPPPPAPVVKPPPPPPPAAPPVPFTFMGRYEDGGVRTILLVKDDRIYTVTEGEVIDKTYRIERLAAGRLELTYLPLGTKQSITAEGT